MMPRPGKTAVTAMVPFGIPGMDANDNKPKGKMTAYAFFVQICRDEHKRKHPDEQVCVSIWYYQKHTLHSSNSRPHKYSFTEIL